MKYCRFLLDNQPFYGAVEDRGGELWIADLTAAPDEDHAFRRIHARSNSISFSFEPMPLSAPSFSRPSPHQDRLRRPQLPRPRQGTWQ